MGNSRRVIPLTLEYLQQNQVLNESDAPEVDFYQLVKIQENGKKPKFTFTNHMLVCDDDHPPTYKWKKRSGMFPMMRTRMEFELKIGVTKNTFYQQFASSAHCIRICQ